MKFYEVESSKSHINRRHVRAVLRRGGDFAKKKRKLKKNVKIFDRRLICDFNSLARKLEPSRKEPSRNPSRISRRVSSFVLISVVNAY